MSVIETVTFQDAVDTINAVVTDFAVQYDLSQDFAMAFASQQNLAIVYPDARTLQVDLDSVEALENFHKNIGQFNNHIALVTKYYQALLGSDIKREFINLLRIRAGQENPILFFEKPLVEDENASF